MKNKKIILVISSFLIIVIIIGILLLNNKEEAKVIRIGDLPVVQGLPLYVAIEKGYFKDAGINVERIKFEAPNQIVDALLQDKIDFGSPSIALGITGIAVFKNPGKLKIYAVSGGRIENPNENLLVHKNSDVKSWEELKGKKLGILGGSIQWRTITRELLNKHGLEMDKDITVVELSPALQVQALGSRQIDALLALEPMSTVAIEQGIGKIIETAPVEKEISNPFYGGAGVVRTQFAKENPETTENVIKIFEKAMNEINENPNMYKIYLKGNTPLNEGIIPKVPIVDFKSCGELSEEDLYAIQKFYDIFTKYKVIDGRISPKNILYC